MWFKAIVMEIKDDYAIVMKSDSTMVRVKIKDDMNVGDSLVFVEKDLFVVQKAEKTNFKEKDKSSNLKNKHSRKNTVVLYLASIAAAIAIFILPMLNKSIDPYAMVSLDINPSIELSLDKKKNIIEINSLNEDANKLNLNELVGLTFDDGISKLRSTLESNGYQLTNDNILLGFTFLNGSENLDYEDSIKNTFTKHFSDSTIVYLKGNKKDYKESNKSGLSIGRYEARFNMDDDILDDELKNMSVEQLLSLLNNENVYLNKYILDEIEDILEDENDTSDDYNSDDDSNSDSDNDDVHDNSSTNSNNNSSQRPSTNSSNSNNSNNSNNGNNISGGNSSNNTNDDDDDDDNDDSDDNDEDDND